MKLDRKYTINGVVFSKEKMIRLGKYLTRNLSELPPEKQKVLEGVLAKLGRSIKHDA